MTTSRNRGRRARRTSGDKRPKNLFAVSKRRDFDVAKPAEVLSPKEMRLIEYYTLGYSGTQSERMAGYDKSNGSVMKRLLTMPCAKIYHEQLQQQYKEKTYCTKEQITRELVNRIPDSNNSDLVKITTLLSRLYGWSLEKENGDAQVNINIGWADDPWIDARDNVNIIDVESEEEGNEEEK